MKIRRATDLTEQYNGMDCQSARQTQKKKKENAQQIYWKRWGINGNSAMQVAINFAEAL